MKKNLLFKMLAVLVVLITSVNAAWAGYNVNWQGKVYFRAPDDWDLSTYSTVQMAVARSTSTNTSTYICYFGTMTRIGTTRLYYLSVSANHSNWNQNEYVFFSANSSTYGDGTFTVQTNHYYTTPLNYDCNTSTTFYYFNPTSEGNGASVSGNYKTSGTYAYLNKTQTVNLYTNGSSSKTGGSVSITTAQLTANTTIGSSGSTTNSTASVNRGAAAGSTVTLTATPASGYAFDGWFEASSGGTAVSTDEEYSYLCKDAKTLYARFKTETTYTITIANSVNASTSTKSVGATPKEITAPDITGYRFTSWSAMPSGVTKTSGNLTDASIYITATKAATVTANYTEDLSSPWVLKGGTNITGDNWATEHAMTKKTGHSTENVAYYTANISSTNSGISGSADAWSFKLIKNSKWYGVFASGSYWWGRGTSANQPLTGEQNIQICADVAGTYEIKVDYTTATPTITVTFPTKYTVTYSVSPSGAANAITTSPSVTSGGSVAAGTSMTFTHAAANTGYSWYRWENGSGSSLGTGSTYTTTINANTTVVAKYTEKTFKVTATASTGGSATPTSATSMGQVTGGDITASPNTGYNFVNWTITSGSGYFGSTGTSTTSTTANTKFRPTAAATIKANFTPKQTTVTLNDQGATTPGSTSVTATYGAAMPEITLPEKTGYTFGGYFGAPGGGGPKYYNADGSSAQNWNQTEATYTLRAYWIPNTYTVNLDLDEDHKGTTAGATTSQTVTYNAVTTTVPSRPTGAEGYGLDGYYTDHNGAGIKLINGDGTWIASVEGYTNADKKWIRADGVTLYAYYKKAEITALTFDAAVVAPGATVGVTPTIDPIPNGSMVVCWTVLHSNDNPLDPQPTITSSPSAIGNKVTFPASETSGMYKVKAELRKGTTCDGDVVSTFAESFQVAGDHTVTLQCQDASGNTIQASSTLTGKPLVWTSVTAPEIFGYTFNHWVAGDGITLSEDGTNPKSGEGADQSTTNPIYIKAIYDGRLTAVYSQNAVIYFKNTLNWSSVYVNFLGDWGYWNNPKGSGNKNVTNRNKQMTQIEGTNIWYYDYGTASITPTLYVSFTEDLQNGDGSGAENFWKTGTGENVVYPANYPDAIHTDKSSENGFKAATPMFVPISQDPVVLNSSGGGKANYYNAGYWTKYTPGTGYTLEIYYSDGSKKIKEVEFTSADDLMPMKAVVDLEASSTYKFQVRRGGTESAGVYYGNKGTMTYKDHGQSTAWEMINTMSPSFSMASITTNAAGDYTFNLSYSAASNQYRLRMAVDYPIAGGDYRVIYKHTGQTNWKSSAIVPKVNNGKDTVSFFIRPGQTPYMKIQQASVNSSTGAITWSDYYSVPTATLAELSGDKVYNACITMNASGGASVEKIEPYTGNYYIRTDCANSKWDNYRSDQDHLMTYSEYSINHGGYSHYYCHWVQTDDRKNIKFTIANDYNPGLSDTLTCETASGTWEHISDFVESNGDIKRNTNVRFMWNQSTNAVSRAYVDGAQEDGSQFLVISSTDGKIKKADGSILDDNKVTFLDNENWIYEANVQAKPQAAYKLISSWGKTGETDHIIDQYFKGSSTTTETLIDGSGTDWYDIRLLYDFKTNRLVAAWVPSDANITTDNAINADVMFIREHQGDIAQLTFGDAGKISKITTAYGVMRFNKYTLANKDKSTHNPLGSPASVYERSLFWISFPFKVKLSEVFGFGTYGTHWAIQYYDGADRAARGHFQENGSFWKWMNRSTEYLEPNQGYLLAIDLDLLGESSNVWGPESKSSQIELYFPSYGTMPDITNADVAQTIPSHECTINWYASGKVPGPDTKDPRTSYNRTIFDSHWNVISVPTYVNTSSVAFANDTWTTKKGPKFLYTWNADDNTITATTASGYTYHAMHAYMTQYAGGITWSAASGSPSSIIARRMYDEAPQEVEFRLELQQNEQMIDQTFVMMSADQEVSVGFNFGEDLTKEFNANKSSIYTFIPEVAIVAGNTLPISEQTTIVPVGVDVVADGDYTFSMPNGTSGVGVTLIDGVTGERTNLALMDYTVSLEKGTYDQRFVLEISPIEHTTTAIENSEKTDAPNTVCKKLIDGVLYIIKDGKVFDARGARLQ